MADSYGQENINLAPASSGGGAIKFDGSTVQTLEALTSNDGVVVGSIGIVLAASMSRRWRQDKFFTCRN